MKSTTHQLQSICTENYAQSVTHRKGSSEYIEKLDISEEIDSEQCDFFPAVPC